MAPVATAGLGVPKDGASDAAREAMFEHIRQDLGGAWLGKHGETYEVMFEGATSRSTTWPCMRRSTSGEVKMYTLRWDGENSVTWGVDYVLLVTELQTCRGRPTWHSARGKRPFVWSRTLGGQGPGFKGAGDSIKEKVPAPPTLLQKEKVPAPPTKRTLLAAAAILKRVSQPMSDRQPKNDPWCGYHPSLNVPQPGPWHPGGPGDPGAGGAGGAARRPPEGEAGADAEAEDSEKAASAALAFMRRVALNEEDGVLIPPGERPRPPAPAMAPFDAEEASCLLLEGSMLLKPPPAGANDTGAEVLLTPRFTRELRVGAAVRALFYGDWHDGSVLRFHGEFAEILWDSEYSMSFVPVEDIRVKPAGTPA